jgi:hypothetical protein
MSQSFDNVNQGVLEYQFGESRILNTMNLGIFYSTRKFCIKIVRPFKIDEIVLPISGIQPESRIIYAG